LALKSRIRAIYLRIYFVCNYAKYYESQTKRHRPKILSSSQERPKAKAKIDRSRKKKGVLDKYLEPLRVYPQCHTTFKMATT